MIGRIVIVAGLSLLWLAAPVIAAESCPDMHDRAYVKWYDKISFAGTDFGTVGFTAQTGRIFVPRPGVSCVTVPYVPLRIIFNHRHARTSEVSYVSFKQYGVRGTPLKTRLLQREGPWERDKKPMKARWEKQDYNKPFPALLSDYEVFYNGDGRADEPSFDRMIGPMHGQPQDADDVDSWDGLSAMRAVPMDLSGIGYIFHSLQRYQTTAGVLAPGTPPSQTADPLNTTLIVQTYSPMDGGKNSTIRFQYARLN